MFFDINNDKNIYIIISFDIGNMEGNDSCIQFPQYLTFSSSKSIPSNSKKGQKVMHLFKILLLSESFQAVMTIMVIIITIRANHWSFQGENYPSVTCLSPETAPKCPYYHHQGRGVCVCVSRWICAQVCVCMWLTPLTRNHTTFKPSKEHRVSSYPWRQWSQNEDSAGNWNSQFPQGNRVFCAA